MNSTKVLSVIVPVYNAEKTLNRCLDSIINQDYKALQVVLIDDGSTDESSKICDEYAALDNRISVIHQENEGVCGARNTGLLHAKGDYVAFVDNDDFILQGMYSRMISEIKDKNLDVCISHFLNGNTESNISSVPNAPKLREGIYDSYDIQRLLFSPDWYQNIMVFALWNKIYKREVIEGIKFSGLWGEDCEFNDYVNSKHIRVGIIREAYYTWCLNKGSQSHQQYTPHWNGILTVIKKRAKLFCDDKDISNRSKEMFCNLYVEYQIISKLKGFVFPDSYTLTFRKFVYELRRDKTSKAKWYWRMRLFQLSPKVYYLMTKKTWQKFTNR